MDPDYELLAAVVAAGSLSAAGRALRISPAMVSKRIARLEARLGVRLIHRTTRKLALTAAGERFHADLLTILQSIREAESRLTGIRDTPRGPLRVSAPTSFGRLHVAPHLHRFLSACPDVELRLDLSDLNVDLIADRVDLAIRITADPPAGLEAHRLGGNRRILCASPAYLKRHGAPGNLGELAQHRLLAADGQLPWRLVNGRQQRLVDGRSHVQTNSSEMVRELAITGAGIALRSIWDVGDQLAAGELLPVLPGWEGPGDLGIFALHPKAASVPPAVCAFIDFLKHGIDPARWGPAGP